MYYVVTGACGFIGANLVKALNEHGVTDILAVDNLEKADKFRNLADCEIADYMDKREFLDLVEHGQLDGGVDAILHQGACSDTMETDGRYMMANNYRYSLALMDFCTEQEIPFLYASSASVYGGGSVFRELSEAGSLGLDGRELDALRGGRRRHPRHGHGAGPRQGAEQGRVPSEPRVDPAARRGARGPSLSGMAARRARMLGR